MSETSMPYQIFGGYLRSSVTCQNCRYSSNTFDPFLGPPNRLG